MRGLALEEASDLAALTVAVRQIRSLSAGLGDRPAGCLERRWSSLASARGVPSRADRPPELDERTRCDPGLRALVVAGAADQGSARSASGSVSRRPGITSSSCGRSTARGARVRPDAGAPAAPAPGRRAGARAWRGGLGIPPAAGRMGRHQPPTNRSFYLSLAASTIRFAIIVALVVGGVVVINQAFQAPASSGSGGGGGGDVPGPPAAGRPPPRRRSRPPDGRDRRTPRPSRARRSRAS